MRKKIYSTKIYSHASLFVLKREVIKKSGLFNKYTMMKHKPTTDMSKMKKKKNSSFIACDIRRLRHLTSVCL